MNRRIFFYFFIFLIIAFFLFYFIRFYRADIIYDITFNLLSSCSKPIKQEARLHLYDDEQVAINHVLIKAYYFVPQDRGNFIINDWQKVFSHSLAKISIFYELQFANNMAMDFEVYPEIIHSDQPVGYFENLIKQDYLIETAQAHAESLTLKEIVDEVQGKVNMKKENNFYVINLFFLTLGNNYLQAENGRIFGLNDEKNNCLVVADAWADEELRDFYQSITAHEITHSLGVPDFYSYTDDQIESYGLMGAGFTRKLENNYLDQEIKKQMGLE